MTDDSLARMLTVALGPTGAAALLVLLARQWFGNKLRELERLKRRATEDRLWRAMARERFDVQGAQIDRLSRNLHYLRNWCTGFQADMQTIATKLEVQLDAPEHPRWDVTQLPTPNLPAELIESGHEDEEPEP